MARIKDQMTGDEKDKGVTEFSDSAEEMATTPLKSAASYSKRVNERRAATATAKQRGKNLPMGHAPPIPPGKLQPIADSARAVQMPQPDFGVQAAPPTKKELEEWAPPPEAPPARPPIPGIGAGYEVNQAMARGDLDRPVSLKEAKDMASRPNPEKPPSEETQALLQAQHDAMQKEDPESEHEALPSNQDALDDAERAMAERKKPDFLDMDFSQFREAQAPLMNPERRKLIEAKLPELDFQDLITKREITQTINVIPGKFTVGFRTVREKEYTWVLQYLYEVTGVSSPAYIEELNSVFRLVCAVVAINAKPLPDHRKNIGQPNEEVGRELFEKKLSILYGFPTHIVADLAVQFNWFSDRVTDLFSADKLKNG